MKDKDKKIDNSWRAKMVEEGLYKDPETTSEEKQIKELAKFIADSCTIRKVYVNKHYHDRQKDMYYSLAEELLKHYQPKLHEDSVVLSMEEYEILTKDIEHPTDEVLKRLLVGKNILTEQVIEKTQKETAEKWYNKVKELYLENVGEQVFEHNWFGVQINKFAKQFKVEIKE